MRKSGPFRAVVAASGDVVQVRSAFLFEVGEELGLQIEQDGKTSEVTVRVRAHQGLGGASNQAPGQASNQAPGASNQAPGASHDTPITELEISEGAIPRPAASR